MLENDKHIDKLFADYLGDYEEKAPGYIWYNIQSDIKAGKSNKRLAIIRAIAASIALLIAFGFGYYFSDFSEKQITKTNNEKDKEKLADYSLAYDTNTVLSTLNITENQRIDSYRYKNSNLQEKNITNTLIFKLFNKNQYNLFPNNYDNKNILKIKSGNKKSSDKKSSNQLLIDTLLFKKENLSERGFLLLKEKNNLSRWSFGTKFSPVYSVADNMQQPEDLPNNQLAKSAVQNNTPDTKVEEKSLLSFSGGFNVNYHFAKRWSIESGLFYSQYRQMSENLVGSSIFGYQEELSVYTPEGIRYLDQSGISNQVSSKVLGTSMDETFYSLDLDYLSNYEYIELPIIVRYKIVDRRVGLDILSGVTTNFLVGNKSTIIYNDNDLWTGTTDGISPLLYNATIGLGLNYDLFQNLSVNIEPTFKYSITLDQPTLLIKYPYKFAVFAGFSYRF